MPTVDTTTKHRLLLQWMILVGVMGFVLFVVWHQGLIELLLGYDRSRISLAILIIFALASGHAAVQVYHLSNELDAGGTIMELLRSMPDAKLRLADDGTATLADRPLPDCLLTQHICHALQQYRGRSPGPETTGEQSVLLGALERRIKGRHSIGWLIADLMFKLGLLGTVIGFILMLGAVTDISDFDVGTMQVMLRDMSGGMRVALFTTLSGLIGGILLGMQYHLVDRGADELLATITEVSEIYVMPRILSASAGAQASGAGHDA